MDVVTLVVSRMLDTALARADAAMRVALPLRGTAILMDVGSPPPVMAQALEDAATHVALQLRGMVTPMDEATLVVSQ